MRLLPPIKGIRKDNPIASPDAIYISQPYGAVWISDRDQVINGIQIHKGDNVYKKVFNLNGHDGVDIAAPKGTEVVACHDGWVIESLEKDTGYGIRVSIMFESEGVQWVVVHGHLLESARGNIPWGFSKAHPIKQGQRIGLVDSTGFSTGNHLHFGGSQYKDGVKLNTNNGFAGNINLWPYVKENYMEFFQVQNEKTIVMKNLDGKYIQIATSPELYPTVAKIFGLEGKSLDIVSREEVDANFAGEAKAGINFNI